MTGYYFDLVRKAGAEPLAIGETGYRQIKQQQAPDPEARRPEGPQGARRRQPDVRRDHELDGCQPDLDELGDTQPALASGAVDAQENPLEVFLVAKINTLGQKYVTKWNYSNDILLFVIAAPVWASWSPADQKIVREAALDAARQQVALVRKLFAEYVVRVSALGVAVHVPTLPEMEAWQIAARRPYARYQAQTEPQLVAKIEEFVAKTRKV